MSEMLSLSQARRIAIAAQGLDRARPTQVSMRHISDTIRRVGLLQIDSVNVLARAHLLPLFARLGPYDTALLDRATAQAPRRIVETWAHEASYVPAATFPLLTWNRRQWPGMDGPTLEAEHPGIFDHIRQVVSDNGPMTSRHIESFVPAEQTQRPKHRWGWSWSPAKVASELLFDASELTPARRSSQFERVYDLTERVLPPGVRQQPSWSREESTIELVRIAARAHGIGTIRCLADYFRLGQRETRWAVRELESAGELIPVMVRGWNRPIWRHAKARAPRRTQARALLAPFDPLIFERRRLQELFGMHYRLEIYTPADQREFGYYVLPFLLGEHLVARTDLKHDRKRGVLLVRSAFVEAPTPDIDPSTEWPDQATIGGELATELTDMAHWLGASEVVVDQHARGDLVSDLLRHFG